VAPPDGTSTDSSLTPSARASLLSASPENPVDLAILVYNESCNELQGYREDCWGERCRLCATCRPGFKRDGSSSKCKQCPDSVTNRALLAVGFVVMLIGTSILVFMTIKAEDAMDEASDAIKKSKKTPPNYTVFWTFSVFVFCFLSLLKFDASLFL
jgi:hypothetical protein